MSKTGLSLILFLLVSSFSSAQDEVVEHDAPFGFEKIYLHTDRPHYFLKDTIWLKSYVLAALAEKGLNPSPSRTLYFNRLGESQNFYQTSKMTLRTKKIRITEEGLYFPSRGIFLEGYMAWEAIGDLMPLGYKP